MSGSAESVLRLARDRAATLGGGRLVCLDGPAGSGKTTLATAIGELCAGVVVHMDDLYPGWSGLAEIDALLGGVLLPLAEGRPGSYRRYDWLAGRLAETVTVEPTPLLVVEGVGTGASRFADLCTLLVWVEAPDDFRKARALRRDGHAFVPHWQRWGADEAGLFARERTRERADVIVDGTRPLS